MAGFYAAVQIFTGVFGGFSLSVLIAGLCLPFEKLFPRLTQRKLAYWRVITIIIVALTGLLVMQAYVWWAQKPVIDGFVRLKIFSLSKLAVPDWVLIVLALLLLDFLYYLAHVLAHYLPPLWRLHKIHHADEHVTAFSGLLHHPFENIYSVLFITGFAVVFGVPVLILVYYGLVLAMHSVFSHADVVLPSWLDRFVRLAVVTPDVHRTHHSCDMVEGNSNFGAVLTLWDRLFGTYVNQPREPLEELTMGLPTQSKPARFSAWELLTLPLRRN